jgi:hypothetical protein
MILIQFNWRRDQVFSEALLKTLPVTGSQYILIIFCSALNLLLYAVSAFNLTTISAVFTVTFLFILLLVRAEGFSAPFVTYSNA